MPQGLTVRPGFMRGCLLPELLSQVLHALQPPDLVQQPLLVALLGLLQVLPAVVDVLWGQERAGLHGGLGYPAGQCLPEGCSQKAEKRAGVTRHPALLYLHACTGPHTRQVQSTLSD